MQLLEKKEQKDAVKGDARLRRMIRTLRNYELLAWKKDVDHVSAYESSSRADVIVRQKMTNKPHIHHIVLSTKQERYFLMQEADLLEQN
jgi:hypothetical protein